jgi:crossover junction endodeoxyribonuclease RuvC
MAERADHQTRVLGIDPGSAATGWALVAGSGTRAALVEAGVIRPRGEDRTSRLADLARRFEAVLARCEPDEVAVETPFTGRNPRSAMVLAEARGVLLAVVGSAGLAAADYTPAEVKSAVVGHGRAEKGQVVFMVTRLLALGKDPARDAADAMAVALTHLHLRRWQRASRPRTSGAR